MRVPALAALLSAGLISLAGTVLVTPAEAAVRNSLTAPRNVVAGEKITLTGVQKHGRTTLTLQRKAGARWVAAGKLRKAPRKFSFTLTVPRSQQGTLRLRVRATVRRKVRTVATTSAPVVVQRLELTAPSAPKTNASTAFTGSLTPTRVGRPVRLQEYLDGAWSDVDTATTQRTAAVTKKVTTAGYPTWYRLRAVAHRGMPAVASAPVRTSLTLVPTAIAHRAGASLAPEQTFAALDRTLADQVPAMEVDVQLTKDGEPVLVHDPDFMRTTDVGEVFPSRTNEPIGSFTLAEVKQLDAGSWFGPQFAGQQVPTLDEWLTRLDARASLVLEVKDPGVAGNAGIWSELDERLQPGGTLAALNDAGKLVVSSFGVGALETFKSAHPSVVVGALTVGPPAAGQYLWAEQIHAMFDFTSRTNSDRARSQGQTMSVWTTDSVADHRTAIATGAERIITDHPENLTAALNPPAPPAS